MFIRRKRELLGLELKPGELPIMNVNQQTKATKYCQCKKEDRRDRKKPNFRDNAQRKLFCTRSRRYQEIHSLSTPNKLISMPC